MDGQSTSRESGKMYEDSGAELKANKQHVNKVHVTANLTILKQLLSSGTEM